MEIKTDYETERSKERNEEDNEFVPVIVKRTDEVIRHPDFEVTMPLKEEVLDQLLENTETPNDLLGQDGLLKV